MKKKSINAFLVLLLSFLFTFTSSCSNLSAIFNNNTTPLVSNNVSSSNIDNDFKKLINSEYKRFSIKAGEPIGTSISLSKRYVLSTKTVQTYQPIDNDSQGQPPNRIKITVVTNKVDATGGVNFTIDGVTSFNVPAPATAGNYAIGTSVITVTDPDATHKQFEFLWDGRYTNGNLVEDGIYTVHALKPSGTKTLFLDTEIEVTSDPLIAAGLEFYTPQQFTDLSNLVGQIKAPEDTANSLYDVVKELETLNNELTSLQARVPVDTIKIADVQKQITDANSKKTVIETELTSSINDLVTKKDSLRSFTNTITKNSTFTQDYPITNKPNSVGAYEDSIYRNDINIDSFKDSVSSIYSSADGTTFEEVYTADKKSVEYIEPYRVNESIGLISDDIQTLNYLISDYKLGLFVSSGINNTSQNIESIKNLSELVKNINKHSSFFKTVSKKVSNDLDRKYKALLKDTADLHYSVQIPIALAMQEEPSMQNHPYVIESLKPLPSNFTIKNYMDWVKNFKGLIDTFNALDPLSPVKERVIRYTLHFDQGQWDSLPQADKTELIKTFSDVVGVIVPTTPSEVVQNLIAGQVFKIVGKVAKSTIGLLKKKITTPAGVISELDNIGKLVRKEEKQIEKNVKSTSIICARPGFHLVSECPIEIKTKLDVKNSMGNRFAGRTRTPTDFIHEKPNFISEVDKGLIELNKVENSIQDATQKAFYQTEVINRVNTFKANGITYNAKGFPDFKASGYVIAEIDILSNNISSKFQGGTNDFVNLAENILNNKVNGVFASPFDKLLPNTLQSKSAIDDYIRNILRLTWHHNQDLKTMQLIPRDIHLRVGHIGGDRIQKIIDSLLGFAKIDVLASYQAWRAGL